MVHLLSLGLPAAASLAAADQVVYSNRELLSGWSDASYDTTASCTSDSITVHSGAYGIFALRNPAVALASFSGVRFDIEANHPELYIFLQSTKNNLNSRGVQLDTLSSAVNPNNFTTITVDFASLPLVSTLCCRDSSRALGGPELSKFISIRASGPWDTISFQTFSDTGVSYTVDNIVLLD